MSSKDVKPKKSKNYLNKRDMLAELKRCHEIDDMTPEFAKMITLLADRYGSRFEYADYAPHIEDMKAVAVMNIVRAWRSFDMEKYDNPFAYFTQAIKHTFWQYVHQEKKHRLNRDHLLIANGELPSDAFMDDIEKEVTKERVEELMSDSSKRDEKSEQYAEEFEKNKYHALPEHQRPGEVVEVDISDYLAELERIKAEEKDSSISFGLHGDILDIDHFSEPSDNNYDDYE